MSDAKRDAPARRIERELRDLRRFHEQASLARVSVQQPEPIGPGLAHGTGDREPRSIRRDVEVADPDRQS